MFEDAGSKSLYHAVVHATGYLVVLLDLRFRRGCGWRRLLRSEIARAGRLPLEQIYGSLPRAQGETGALASPRYVRARDGELMIRMPGRWQQGYRNYCLGMRIDN